MSDERTPLYSETSHSLARAVAGSIALFACAGFVLGAQDLLNRPTVPTIAAMTAFVAFTFAVVRMLTRPQRIYGTSQGLAARTGKATRLIPWSRVSQVERPISSFNPVFRRYYVTVLGEEKRIYFFAGRREI